MRDVFTDAYNPPPTCRLTGPRILANFRESAGCTATSVKRYRVDN